MIYLKIKKHFRGTNSRSLVLTHKPNYENNTYQLCQYMFTFINFLACSNVLRQYYCSLKITNEVYYMKIQ